jgi:hypothetical protein
MNAVGWLWIIGGLVYLILAFVNIMAFRAWYRTNGPDQR